MLTDVPGSSKCFVGSLVTYQNESKVRWLSVSNETIQHYTEVSDSVAIEMAMGGLQQSPAATIAASITGHLGPHAPEGFDGRIHIGIASGTVQQSQQHQLTSQTRLDRKHEAAGLVLESILHWSQTHPTNTPPDPR